MLLKTILTWVLNNSVLLFLQDAFVSPVLKRLPESRYGEIRYSKNVLFKLFCIGAGTLTARHLANKDTEMSFRYASEIVANQGYSFYSQQWKVYLIYVGLIHAHRKNHDQASIWLAEGVAKQKTGLFNLLMTQSYPDDFVHWLDDNREAITTVEGWQALFSECNKSEDQRELLLIYIVTFISSLGLPELVAAFLDTCEIKNHSDWQKMIAVRQVSQSPSYCRGELSSNEVWNGTYNDTAQKLAANLLYRTFAAGSGANLHETDDYRALSKETDYQHVSHALFPQLINAFALLNQMKYAEAEAILRDTITVNAEILDTVRTRTGPAKIFLAGFGWSGSSAVHDACRGYPHTKDMPGAGDLPFLNVGADSEPMLHQGPASLQNFIGDIDAEHRISAFELRNFCKNYILLMPSYGYAEYKVVNSSRSIKDHLGIDKYYLLICEFLYQYAISMQSEDEQLVIAAVDSFQENIVNAMFSDDDTVFFNNSIFAHRAKVLEHIRGRSYYVVVNRSMSDQFCDQMRSNRFFNATFLEFYLVKLSRIVSYKWAKYRSTNKGVEFVDIMFESWIQDAALRERIARKICGTYDIEVEQQFFDPKVSQKNINIPRDHLGLLDKTSLKLLESIGMSI